MKKTILITVLALSSTLCLFAQPAPGPQQGHRPPMDPIMSALDADTNSVISTTELAGASAALAMLDADSDGTLSAAELTPKRAGAGNRPPGGPSGFVPPLLKALDADGDGALSKEEIANAAVALKTLDKNSDGQLSRDEIMPQRPGGPGAGPGGGGR